MQTRNKGVTLIELMIVVVIIAVLAGIAYPSYRGQMVQSRRSDAQIALTRIAAAQEKFFSDCGYYARTVSGTRACGTLGDASAILGEPAQSQESQYDITIAEGNSIGACTGASKSYQCGFIATATPSASGRQVGNGNLRIDATGSKGWDKAKNGAYSSKWTDK